MHNVRERVRESGSNANTEICFEVRAQPSHRRISTNSYTQDFPHMEPPLRILGKYNLGVHNSSLNQYNLSLEARHKAKQLSTSQMRDRALSHIITITSTLRGIQTPLPQSPLTRGISTKSPLTRGYHKEWKVYNLVISKTTK